MNILVVDDHKVGRRLLRAIFEAEHMNVFEAGDGIEALAKLEHDRIDAVVADILMPRMDGYRLCQELRSHVRLHETPVIFYSATYTAAEDVRLAIKLGADRFLRKPSPPALLIETVRDCIERGVPHPLPEERPAELELTRSYSERLVAKLEQRNVELEETRAALHQANALLEWRVQRRTEELAVANRQLESFASFVAHEVRAPLRAIHGSARQVQEDFASDLPPEARRLVKSVARAARQTERLTDALLQFCHLGAQPVRRRKVDLDDTVRAALAALAGEWKERTNDVVTRHLPTCDGDAVLLEHVFRNLLDNALKFTRTRLEPHIEVGVRTGDGPPVFFVRDNGVGFDMRYAELVFEPFQPLHRDEGFEGTGLGLNLVRTIITRHGGSIWAESAQDHGATFFFALEPIQGGARPEPADLPSG